MVYGRSIERLARQPYAAQRGAVHSGWRGSLAPRQATSAAGQVLVGSYISEGGHGLAWLDMDGNKLHGQEWVGDAWTAASQLARDTGDNPVPNVYAYTAAPFLSGKKDSDPNKIAELRLNELLVPAAWGRVPSQVRFGTGKIVPSFPEPTW